MDGIRTIASNRPATRTNASTARTSRACVAARRTMPRPMTPLTNQNAAPTWRRVRTGTSLMPPPMAQPNRSEGRRPLAAGGSRHAGLLVDLRDPGRPHEARVQRGIRQARLDALEHRPGGPIGVAGVVRTTPRRTQASPRGVGLPELRWIPDGERQREGPSDRVF